MNPDNTKQQFIDAMKHMESVKSNAVVRVEELDYLMTTCYKLLMKYEDVMKGRASWRLRAEIAEAKLKL